jgi:hypothetical protein
MLFCGLYASCSAVCLGVVSSEPADCLLQLAAPHPQAHTQPYVAELHCLASASTPHHSPAACCASTGRAWGLRLEVQGCRAVCCRARGGTAGSRAVRLASYRVHSLREPSRLVGVRAFPSGSHRPYLPLLLCLACRASPATQKTALTTDSTLNAPDLDANHAPLLVSQLLESPHTDVHVVDVTTAPALVAVPAAAAAAVQGGGGGGDAGEW